MFHDFLIFFDENFEPKIAPSAAFSGHFEARKCASRCGWACEAWFLPVFSRFVM